MGPQDIRGGTEVTTGIRQRTVTAVPRLVATAGPGAGRAVAMANSLATVGRHATNDLVIADPQVSGVHLELRRVGERVHLRDAGSTNGTCLGSHRVTDIELAQGGQIVIGGTTLRLDLDDTGPVSIVTHLKPLRDPLQHPPQR